MVKNLKRYKKQLERDQSKLDATKYPLSSNTIEIVQFFFYFYSVKCICAILQYCIIKHFL